MREREGLVGGGTQRSHVAIINLLLLIFFPLFNERQPEERIMPEELVAGPGCEDMSGANEWKYLISISENLCAF